jgi:hypothetical protein
MMGGKSERAGEPQIIPARFLRRYDTSRIPWLRQQSMFETTAQECARMPWLVKIFKDDTVELFQTRAQAGVSPAAGTTSRPSQADLVAKGYTVFRYDDDGNAIPLAFDPATQQWEDVAL